MKRRRTVYTDTQKQRVITSIKQRLKKHKLADALRQVGNVEQIPLSTLTDWYYQRKQLEAEWALAAEEKLKNRVRSTEEGRPASDGVVGLVEPAKAPEPAHLLTNGQLSCSRCSSRNIERRAPDSYYCPVCRVFLLFEGWPEEKTKEYNEHGSFKWML